MPTRNRSTAQQPLSFGNEEDSIRYWIRQTLERTCPAADVLQLEAVEEMLVADTLRLGVYPARTIAWITDPTANHTDQGWREYSEKWRA